MITPDELEILRKPEVQEYIREKMGEWQIRDVGYSDELGVGILHGNGLMYFDKAAINPEWCKEIIRLPLAIDSDNPERGLWGMVDWYRFHIGDSVRNGSLWVLERGCVWDTVATPYLALLRALAHQIGKVK
jgi:hypothetical protein